MRTAHTNKTCRTRLMVIAIVEQITGLVIYLYINFISNKNNSPLVLTYFLILQMRWQSDQNLRWAVSWVKPKLFLSLKTSCTALMNIQTLVHIEILRKAAETEQMRKLSHLEATRVKKLSGKPLPYAVYSSVTPDECLSTLSLEMSSALALRTEIWRVRFFID